MNQKPCKTCGQMIANNARKCPNCGHTYSRVSGFIAYGVIFIVVIIMIDYASKNLSINKNYSSGNSNSSDKITNELSYLKQYEGMDVSTIKLYSTEPLKTRLINLLGSKFSFFTKYSFMDSYISIENNIFYTDGFQEHNAGNVNYILWIDLESNIISLGIHVEKEVELFSEDNSKIPGKLIEWKKAYKNEMTTADENSNNRENEFKVGSIISNNKIEFSVEKIGYYESTEHIYKKNEENKIFYVSVYIKNLDLSSLKFNLTYFTIKDSHGYVYEPTYWGREPLFTYGSLSKGEIVRGFINFELPANISEMKLIYSLSLFGNNKIIVNLSE